MKTRNFLLPLVHPPWPTLNKTSKKRPKPPRSAPEPRATDHPSMSKSQRQINRETEWKYRVNGPRTRWVHGVTFRGKQERKLTGDQAIKPVNPDPPAAERVESRNRSTRVFAIQASARWHHRNVDLPTRSRRRSRLASSPSANENYVTRPRAQSVHRILAQSGAEVENSSKLFSRRDPRIQFLSKLLRWDTWASIPVLSVRSSKA